MSYGRQPYYIFAHTDDAETVFGFYEGGEMLGLIPYDAMAQFLASMDWRRNGELEELIDRGRELRPELMADGD